MPIQQKLNPPELPLNIFASWNNLITTVQSIGKSHVTKNTYYRGGFRPNRTSPRKSEFTSKCNYLLSKKSPPERSDSVELLL